MAFSPGSAVVWGLGPYDNPDISFNGRDDDGVDWVCRVDGWNKTSVEVPTLEGGADGAYLGPGRRKPRVLTLTGAFRGPVNKLEDAEWRLRAAIERYLEDTVLWRSAPTAQQMGVRLTGDCHVDEVEANPKVRTFSAVLTAGDPLKYAAGAAGLVTLSTGMQAFTTGGMTWPAQFPLSFGGASTLQGRITAYNRGRLPVWPKVTLTGPGPGLRVTHLERMETIGYRDQMVAGQSVLFDHKLKSVIGDGRSQYTMRLSGSVFFPITPGTNTLAFTGGAYDAAARASICYRPAWP